MAEFVRRASRRPMPWHRVANKQVEGSNTVTTVCGHHLGSVAVISGQLCELERDIYRPPYYQSCLTCRSHPTWEHP